MAWYALSVGAFRVEDDIHTNLLSFCTTLVYEFSLGVTTPGRHTGGR